jgi:hypothetical protein
MPKSPLVAEPIEHTAPDYTEAELKYWSGLQKRLKRSQSDRDTARTEWDGMSYTEQYEENERLAATQIRPRLNRADTDYQSGIIRQKIFALLAALNRQNLEGELVPYDNNGVPVPQLGEAVTVVLRQTEELEGDEEKRLLRQYELLAQGTVFVEEHWKTSKKTKKKLEEGFRGRPDQAKWTTQLADYLSYPCRTILDGRGVYLGDLTQIFMSEQPYIFTVDVIPYEAAKSIFGEWERWDNVPEKLVTQDANGVAKKVWSLTQPDQGMVEVIKYQDKWNDEFQIILNGVMMLPLNEKGECYPLSKVSPDCEYTIVKQILKVISPKFAYGKSICMEMRPQAAVFDEMSKLMVLKTQKSYMPPKANNTGKVLSQKNLMAGTMTMGVDPSRLVDIDEKGSIGVTAAEFNALQWLSDNLDALSVNKSFQGQNSQSDTATEAIQIQEQSSLMVDLIVAACAQLEKQLTQHRCALLIEHWFKPQTNGSYRTALVDKYIPDVGEGQYMVSATVDAPGRLSELMGEPVEDAEPETVYKLEEKLAEKLGGPVRVLLVDPEALENIKYEWMAVVNPTPKRGSNQTKLMFRAEINDAAAFFPGQLNPSYWQDRFADIWGEDPQKAFAQAAPMPGMAPVPTLEPGQGVPQPSAAQNSTPLAV